MSEGKLISQSIAALQQLTLVKEQLRQQDTPETHDALMHFCDAIKSLRRGLNEIAMHVGLDLKQLNAEVQAAAEAGSAQDLNLSLRTVVTWATLWPEARHLASNANIEPSEIEVVDQVQERMVSYANCLLGCNEGGQQAAIVSQTMRELSGE